MDTSDSKIKFDRDGICDHCNDFEINVKPNWYPNEEGKKRLTCWGVMVVLDIFFNQMELMGMFLD